ncbi:MAG TPA: tRNA (5-methylaminomethyl-2-thiouridine)(34)-methyltransferase MnmD [Meiothermus sp.]|nr:tRNA (5-methylaminomethyl-2-thiouridine)(34)-methyltransferase MnmD [Meiothermus sp.]
MDEFSPFQTEDGSLTLIHPWFKEAYSSKHGAWMQANELYLKLTKTHEHPGPRVLEIGFGLGVNFRATLQSAVERGVRLEYLSYELFPVPARVLEAVRVCLLPEAAGVWSELLESWPRTPISDPYTLRGDWGRLEVRFEDVTQADFPHNWATALYLDPFSPEVNPEPWSLEVMKKLYRAAQPEARLATYSVAGSVRRDLARAGFQVERVPGVGKRAWTQAVKF